MAKSILHIALLLLITTSLSAQTLTGRVYDVQTKEPLIGANLYLESDWLTGTSTDTSGGFKMEIQNWNDSLVISYIGYNEKKIVLNSGDQHLSIALEPVSTSMDEIVISSEKLVAEEFTYRKIDRLDIYTNPSAKADPLLAVNSLPSTTTLDESANISFRGSSPAQTGIFFNNVPIYDAVRFSQLNGIGTFSIFNTAIVDQLQVFPGNPPLEFGNTTSGLISLQTTEAIPEKASNSITLSLASYGALTTRPINERTALTIFTNYQPSGLIRKLNYESLEQIKKFQSNDLGLYLINQINDHQVLKFFNYTLFESYDFKYEAPTFSGEFEQRKRRNFSVINWRTSLDKHELSVNGNISFSESNFNYADTDINIDNADLFGSFNYKYSSQKFELKSGLHYDRRSQQFDGTFYQFDYAEGPGFPTLSQSADETLIRPELYLYGKYYLTDQLIVGTGIRKNIVMEDQENYLSRQLNIRYDINESLSIRGAWGKYHKYNLTQNSTEQTSLLSSQQLSLDAKYKTQSTELSLSIFRNENKNFLETTDINGLEIFLRSRFFKKLTGQISYTLIDGTTSREEIDFSSTYDLNYFVKGNLEYRFSSAWETNITFLFRDGRLFRPVEEAMFNSELEVYQPTFAPLDHQERLPAYQTVDLSISRLIPVSEKLNIITFASVSNVFNHKNVNNYTYNFDYSRRNENLFSQRTVYFGVVINF